MAITTWLSVEERKALTSVQDKDLDELYQEVNALFPGQFYVAEIEYTIPGVLFMPAKRIMMYTIYSVINNIDVQVINFGGLGAPVNAMAVGSFFIGVMAGNRLTLKPPTK